MTYSSDGQRRIGSAEGLAVGRENGRQSANT